MCSKQVRSIYSNNSFNDSPKVQTHGYTGNKQSNTRPFNYLQLYCVRSNQLSLSQAFPPLCGSPLVTAQALSKETEESEIVSSELLSLRSGSA